MHKRLISGVAAAVVAASTMVAAVVYAGAGSVRVQADDNAAKRRKCLIGGDLNWRSS